MDDGPEVIAGITLIPCISLKEEAGKIGAAVPTAGNSPGPRKSPGMVLQLPDSLLCIKYTNSYCDHLNEKGLPGWYSRRQALFLYLMKKTSGNRGWKAAPTGKWTIKELGHLKPFKILENLGLAC